MKFRYKNLAAFILSSSVLVSMESNAEIIKDIKIDGNERIERETILNYLPFKKGEDFKDDFKKETIESLYQTNLFDDIKFSFNNGIAQISIKETSLVTKIDFVGNSRIKTATLTKELISRKGSSLSNAAIREDLEKIKEIYRKSGRYAVSVNARTEKLENNRSKIIFEISEGPKTGIKYINFIGNNLYKDSELRSVILTKESAWFRFLDTSDTYDPDRIEHDKYLLKRFYNSVGYADFRVISTNAELSQTKEYFTINYTVHEGRKFNFGNADITSNLPDVSAEDFRSLIDIKSGKPYNLIQIEKIVEEINDKLADMGYTGAFVDHEEEKDYENGTVSIKFIIEKGVKAKINKININGNLKTRDNVIRRQFKINEGDLFNRSAISKGEQNIRNLDYFETVSVDTELSATDKSKVDVNVNVEEKSTSSIQFEVGYNSMEGPVGRINFVERNLLGTGKYLTAGIDKYQKKTSYHAGLTDPYFMDKDLLVGASMFNVDSKGSGDTPYALKSLGGNLRAGYDVATDLRHDLVYTLKEDELSGRMRRDTSIFISEQFGRRRTSSIGNTLTYDKRDSAIVPKNGYVVSATETVAGVGGDTKFMKHEADFKIFKSIYDNNITFKIAGEAGYIEGFGGKKVTISDRFYLGDFTMRGFDSAGLGPRDKRTKEALGGKKYYTLTTEVLFPIGFPKEFNVSGALFTDVGGLWDIDVKNPSLISKNDVYNSTNPRVSVGAGIVWITRFAPIRLDYAIAVKKEKYDETQRLHFRFSTSF